ncbi:MAG: VanZ family protein [Candidatus Aminicenantes bacterium]|nr:VanZ family protein [Candidatus Aminicenantes bacterium]
MKKALPFLPAALYYGLIYFLSSRRLNLDVPLPNADKLAHGAAYGLLGFLLAFGFFKRLRLSLKTKLGLVILTGVGLGILDEIHQIFVPGRTPDPLDAAADALGVALGLFLFRLIFQKKPAEKSN